MQYDLEWHDAKEMQLLNHHRHWLLEAEHLGTTGSVSHGECKSTAWGLILTIAPSPSISANTKDELS
jgi:hypothetical protein